MYLTDPRGKSHPFAQVKKISYTKSDIKIRFFSGTNLPATFVQMKNKSTGRLFLNGKIIISPFRIFSR